MFFTWFPRIVSAVCRASQIPPAWSASAPPQAEPLELQTKLREDYANGWKCPLALLHWRHYWDTTGCPVKLFPLYYLLFCRLLLIQNAKVGTFLKNSENLLHDGQKNFENRFRNSWDNWGQSWQPSFRNWHFAITQRQKNNFYAKGGNFDLNYLSYF